MNVSNTLAPSDYRVQVLISAKVKETSDILKDLELIDFEETDDLMRSMISWKPDVSYSGVTNVSMSGSVFNNCTFNFSK